MDVQKLLDGVVAALMSHVAAEIKKVRSEVELLGARVVAPPDASEVAKRAAALIQPAKDGRDGIDGKDGVSVPLDAIRSLVEAEVIKAIATIPKPRDGIDGKDGINGRDGADGNHGADGKDGRDGVNGKDGADGMEGQMPTVDLDEVVDLIRGDAAIMAMLRGAPGDKGDRGDKGEKGDAGAPVDPDDIERVTRRHFDAWALGFERLATDRQRAAIEAVPEPRDGRDGKDGKPGWGLEDFELECDTPDDGRTLNLKLSAGGRSRSMEVRTATILDRGVFVAGSRYLKGDAVTFAASLWIAQRDDPKGKPGETDAWRLSVRRGKDGKDGTQ